MFPNGLIRFCVMSARLVCFPADRYINASNIALLTQPLNQTMRQGKMPCGVSDVRLSGADDDNRDDEVPKFNCGYCRAPCCFGTGPHQ